MTAQRSLPVLVCAERADRAERVLRHASALLRPRLDVVSTVDLNPGSKPDAILAQARRQRAGLIVLGPPAGPHVAPPLGVGLVSALVNRTDIPVLVVRAEDDSEGPLFVCYDGSSEAKGAIAAAGDLLAERETIVASFLPPFDDAAVLRETLPWPASSETEDHLARIDQGEAELLTERTNEGVDLATRAGLMARPLGIETPGVAWDRLLAAADAASPSCVVIGHRSNIARLDSTAVEVVHHAGCPVLVVPRSG